MTTAAVFHGSAADPTTTDLVEYLLSVELDVSTCTACRKPGAVYGYWMCVLCLEAPDA
jgi:hypothetical protein